LQSHAYNRIILTRPRVQNLKLKNKLDKLMQENGMQIPMVLLPLLEIVPLVDQQLAVSLHQALSQADWVSFVSPNAFLMANTLLQQFGFSWPKGLKIAVVGGGSEQSIRDSGLDYALMVKPENNTAWDSEGLWQALNQVQTNWQHSRVVMVHGEGGRTFLTDHLQSAGAQVTEFAVYQRLALPVDDSAWLDLLGTPPGYQVQADVWMFSSSQAAQSLAHGSKQLSVPHHFLENSLAFVSHPRIEESVLELGFKEVRMILPGDDELFRSLAQVFQTGL